jgi:Protein of unknown function (DUF3592)
MLETARGFYHRRGHSLRDRRSGEFAEKRISWPFFSVEIVFLFAGLPFVAVGIVVIASELGARRGAWPVPATVIGFSTGERDGYYHSVAEYVGPDGVTRYIEGSLGSSAPLASVGDIVTVLVKAAEPEQAVLQSALSYVVGAVIGAMGLASCAVFFATFRGTPFSIGGAAVVSVLAAYKVVGSLRSKRISLQEWRDKRKALRPRVFTEATKSAIRWAHPAALDAAILKQRKANRFAAPILLLGGVGLVVLGAHLHRSTSTFLAKAAHAPGRVVGLAVNHSTDNDTYSPVVEFEALGHTYRFKDSIGSSPPSYRRGDEVAVLYDPDQPRNARIDRGRWNKAMPLLVSAFGALLCSLGVWIVARRRPDGAA